jgi:hypothetical protein
MMKEQRLNYPIPLLGRMLSVSASGYYAWVDRPLSQRAREEIRLELEIRAADRRTRQTYGPERLQYDLAEHGIRVGICPDQAHPEEARHTLQAEEEIQGHHSFQAQAAGSGEPAGTAI